MVQRVDHGVLSATATTGWETAKGGLLGALAVTAAGAIGGALIGAFLLPAVGAGIGAAVLGVASFFVAGPIATVVGTGLGAYKGVHRVKDENAAYANRQHIIEGHAANQTNAVAQQAFAMGVQAGQKSVVEELQRARAHMIQEQMMQQAMANKAPVGTHTAKVCQDRAAAPAAGQTVA